MRSQLTGRTLVAKLHAWLGAIASLFILAITVSGVAIAFSAPLLHLETGAMPATEPRPADQAVNLGRLVREAQAAAGAEFIPLGYLGPNAEIATNVEMIYGLSAPPERGGETQIITFDPVSGGQLGTIFLDQTLTHRLIDFHYELLAGPTGAVVVAVIGVFLAGLAVVGVYLWWPLRGPALKKMRVLPNAASGGRMSFRLHSFIGFWAALLVVIWGLTGVYWSQPNWAPDVIRPATYALSADAERSLGEASCKSSVSIEEAVEIALMANPGKTLWEAEFAAPWQPYHTLYLSAGRDIDRKDGDTRVWVSSTCPELSYTADVSGLAALGAMAASVHSGESFGSARIPVVAVVGLLLCVLAGTGIVVWFRRYVTLGRRQ